MSTARVPEHLAGRALLPLWHALHDRLSSGRTVRSVTLRGLDGAAQEALADLLGWSAYSGPSATVRLDRVEEALAPSGLDAAAVVEAVVGPLTDRAAQRARAAVEREELWSWLAGHPVVAAEPALLRWVDQVRSEGVPRGAVGLVRNRLEQALAVVSQLPLTDGRPLPDLAAEITGDPHGLDGTKPLARLVLQALSTLRGHPQPEGAQQRRELWGAFGVACDVHSSTVLVLGLHSRGAGPLATTLRTWAEAGRAAVVTLDQLSAGEPLSCPAPVVYVVENPSVMALAQQHLGTGCPPLVCVSGWPDGAAVAFLQQVAREGADLRYHGDFDGEGLRIAAHVMARTGARPWRMATGHYLEAVGNVRSAPPPGRLTPVPWDEELDGVIAARGVAVHEERVAEQLLEDLGYASRVGRAASVEEARGPVLGP